VKEQGKLNAHMCFMSVLMLLEKLL